MGPTVRISFGQCLILIAYYFLGVCIFKRASPCVQKAVYKSPLLRDLLRATSVRVCINKTLCESGMTSRKKVATKNAEKGLKDTDIVIIVVCLLIGLIGITLLLYCIRQKR